MRILYFSFVDLDVPNACQVHTFGILSGFGKNKSKVDAVVPRPKLIHQNIHRVNFFYIWPWRFSPLGKLWVKLLGGIYFFVLCFLNKYDAIYVRELESNPFPRWCSNIFRIPYYIEVNGLYILDKKVCGTNRNNLRKIERHQQLDYICAAGLIVSSFPRSRWIIENYNLKPDKVHTILNGVTVGQKSKLSRDISLERLNLPEDGFYLGFLGSVWKNYDLISTIRAMDHFKIQLPNLYLIIIGAGPEMPYIKQIAKRIGLSSKIVDLGFIQSDDLYKVIGAIDVALMNLTRIGLDDLGPITTRFATYAAFQIPVLTNSLYLENYPQELTKGLFTIPHEDPQALANKILWLYNHPEERKKNARILYDFVKKNLTWDFVSKEIKDIISHDKKLNSRG
jgi:glycosyltransferase involved in cell wall biosynthesis